MPKCGYTRILLKSLLIARFVIARIVSNSTYGCEPPLLFLSRRVRPLATYHESVWRAVGRENHKSAGT